MSRDLAMTRRRSKTDSRAFRLHYDWYESDNELTSGAYTGEPVLQNERVVPAVTYVIIQNRRITLYLEEDLSDTRGREFTDSLRVKLRTIFREKRSRVGWMKHSLGGGEANQAISIRVGSLFFFPHSSSAG